MPKKILNIHEVLKRLPHRPPFILVDKVIDVELGKSLVAIKNLTMNEPFFTGHFPQYPVMPGVLILEALAQAATVLAYVTLDENPNDGPIYLFAGVDKARFRQQVFPGDQLKLHVEVLKIKQKFWVVKGIATVDDKLVCSAELMSARMDRPA